MNPHQLERLLKKEGFVLWKNGSKHRIWVRGDIVIPVPNGTKMSPRSLNGTMKILKQLRKERKMKN